MQKDGVLRQPGRYCAVKVTGEQSFALAVIAVEGHFVNIESTEGISRLEGLVRTDFGRDVQYAAGFHRVVPLRGVFRVGDPFFGNVGFTFRKSSLTGIVTLYVNVGQPEQVRIAVTRRFRFGKSQVFQLEGINIQGSRRMILHFHPFADDRNLVIDGKAYLYRHILEFLASPECKDQFLSRCSLFVQRPAVTCPRQCFADRPDFEILHQKRLRDSCHVFYPLIFQIGPFRLSR